MERGEQHPKGVGQERLGDGRHRRKRRVKAGATALLVAAVTTPMLAGGAHADTRVDAPHLIEVLPGLDIVGLEGYDADDLLTVEVWRDGVKVGSTGAPQPPGLVVPDEDEIAQPMSTLLEINHDAGTCWSGHTPDVMAGDQIRVLTAGGGSVAETVDVADIVVNEPQIEALDDDGEANDVVMTGRALAADGSPIDPAGAEAEIVQPALRDVGVPGWDRRVLRASVLGTPVGGDTTFHADGVGTLEYDTETGEWVATWKNLPVPTADRPSFAELALDGEHNFMLSAGAGNEDTGGVATTVGQPGDASGGVPGCPAGSSYGVKGSSPANVNIATSEQDSLVLSGTAYNAHAVEVTLSDVAGHTLVLPATLSTAVALDETTEPVEPVRQTWSVAVPMDKVRAGLEDGMLTASAVYEHVVETEEQREVPVTNPEDPPGQTTQIQTVYTHTVSPRTGTSHTLLKDLQAPQRPTASIDSGTYVGAQQVQLSAGDEVEETVRYRMGGADVPNPTGGSPAVAGQVAVTASQTVKARAFDRAGNPGPVLRLAYTIVPPGQQDTTAPVVAAQFPTAGTRRVRTGRVVRVVFDEPVDNVTEGSVQLRRASTGRLVRAAVSVNESTRTARLDPVRKLAPGTRYRVLVSQVTDEAGNEAALTGWSFVTDPRPRVRARTPRPGARDVARRRTIRVRASEPLRGVSRRFVQLHRARNDRRVAAVVRYRRATRTVVIDPRRRLAQRTAYTVTLRRGVHDRDGHALSRTRWRFRTR